MSESAGSVNEAKNRLLDENHANNSIFLANNDLGMSTTKLDSKAADDGNKKPESAGTVNETQNGLILTKNNMMANPNSSFTECSTLVQSSYGTIKKTVLYSPVGFLLQWTTICEAGSPPFYSLLLATGSASIAIIMLLFGDKSYGEWWFITFLVFFIIASILSLCFISLFIQDDSIKTFKVRKLFN